MTQESDAITLRLEGSRAEHGVSLSDFENFIDSFLGALRDFDRYGRSAPTKKSGRPEKRAEVVTAFRLVKFQPGSGIATIEPDLVETPEDSEVMVDAEPLPVVNLRALLGSVEAEKDLPPPVTDSLEKACRTLGSDGSIRVDLPRPANEEKLPKGVVIDIERLQRIRKAVKPEPAQEVTAISGRLHQVDFEPDKLAIRASDGIDWISEYPEELEPQIEMMVNKLVWAEGTGHLQSPRRGTMKLTSIRQIDQGVQTDFFSHDRVPDEQLEAELGITEAQGIEAIAGAEWTDADDAYLAALTDD